MLFDLVTLYIGAGFGLFAVGAVAGWLARDVKEPAEDAVDAEDAKIYDLAGNVFDMPSPRVDLIVNTLTPLGFLAVQLRLCGDYANDRGIIDDAGRALDAAVESLKKDLTPCADCGQINGNHLAKCAGWDGALRMDWVTKEPKDSDDAATE